MKKIAFGLSVIAAGILLLGFNLGYIDPYYKHIVFSWQMLLITLGIINICGRDSWILGAILIAVGGFFIIPMISAVPYSFISLFWPALLIIIGFSIIVKKGFGHKHPKCMNPHRTQESSLDAGYITEKNVFGGSKQKVAPCEFKGGMIHNVFGGTELDLRQTTLAEGKNVLEIKCVFGGVSLIVPPDWIVHIEVTAVMGGFVDKRSINPSVANPTRELFIKGEAVFGGGDIKSF